VRRSETEDLVERPNEVQEVILWKMEPYRKSHDLFPVSKTSHVGYKCMKMSLGFRRCYNVTQMLLELSVQKCDKI